jgi:hypothetical protein
MLPVGTESDRTNPIHVSSQRRNSLHTFDTGICHQSVRISQHLFILTFASSTTSSASRTASIPTLTIGKEAKQIETIPFPPKEKKKEELTT